MGSDQDELSEKEDEDGDSNSIATTQALVRGQVTVDQLNGSGSAHSSSNSGQTL